MITSDQVKAARAILNWPRDTLAKKTGLNAATIKNFENGEFNMREDNLSKIKTAIEVAGLEFIEGGIRKSQNLIQILEGKEGFIQFYHLVYHEVQKNGGEILIKNEDEEKLKEILEEWYDIQANRMAVLRNFKCRSLIRASSSRELQVGYCQYLPIPDQHFSEGVSFYIFGQSYATFIWRGNPKIILVDYAELAHAQREEFNILWEFYQGENSA